MLTKKIVKYIQSLSQKKLRDKEDAFIAEGPKVVEEFLLSGVFDCKIICADPAWLLTNDQLLKKSFGEIYESDEDSLKKISLLKTANKVVGVFNKREVKNDLLFDNKITLLLDDISDPGNMGSIIRIADWFAVANIVCSDNCVDCYNPKVVQATMGSLGRVNIIYTDIKVFLLNQRSINVYAATLSGTKLAKVGTVKEGFILIGNESRGISEELLSLSKNHITIPRYGNAESLNAAVATGIILSHVTADLS
ncbi:MAG: RNA methyltransferase [Ginsengibacter sp.]